MKRDERRMTRAIMVRVVENELWVAGEPWLTYQVCKRAMELGVTDRLERYWRHADHRWPGASGDLWVWTVNDRRLAVEFSDALRPE
jgi:hypothetical protein